ncbi:hypothetical protein K450DRAFT_225891 [Umbelopsis ramanniana AG]|uniref:Uncharacterized protein n=1 Tax=Umbelopsis ramanniana AG TaxID=1314678 RepID=A0AAD5HG01_UMBRA|nr:uncharacterized protein K450DRAFT_225891 [Umbelopsis ramanniana AG]KAI8583007.1 hypothetical protein K450DRAFT_225891 [Umbelopsis ramanniana AG]
MSHTDPMAEVDLHNLTFTETVNANLICCICHAPFVEPMASPCGHIFCESCIYQALESASQCPVDRSPLALSDLKTAVKIIHNMVNELQTYCPRVSFGCNHVGQRHMIEHHLKNDCEYTLLPCELEECGELILKKDMNSHVETCRYRMSECMMCRKKMRAFELEDHHELCPAEIVKCPHCEITNVRSDHMKHLGECPEHPIPCTLSPFGCKWIGARKNLATIHQKECAYEGIKDFLYQQKQREDALHEELNYARRGYESLNSQLEGINTQVSHMQDSLSAMFPSYFQSYRSQDMYNDDEPITDLNDVPLSPQEIIMSDNERLKNDIETITANIASLELKQNVALMTETLRMQEEMQSLRALCHGLRMQMHYVLMERRGNVGGPSTSTAGANATPGASTSTNAPTNPINGITRMRNWIGWSFILRRIMITFRLLM